MKALAARRGRDQNVTAPEVPPGSKSPTAAEFVDAIIARALEMHASDVHLEPNEHGLQVRFRVHGLLQNAMSIPPKDRASVVSRVKILASLDIAEHRLPQDGRIRLRENDRAVDARVSTMPSLHGEKVVLRLLDLNGVAIPLDRIGLRDLHLQELRRLIRRPQGIILVTGPTGSGKTSTIYGCMREIKSEVINIVTIEDPIEYEVSGITQIGVNDKIGLTFESCLRSVLRQDPDVILVGEIRDRETARIAMQASLTGHLVFATLHTNDAVGAITRLLDMDIPPYLIASSLAGVMAQRLVQQLCPDCKKPTKPDPELRAMLQPAPSVVYARGGGCERCHGLGATGRVGVFELVTITPAIRALILSRATEAEIHEGAHSEDFPTMFRDGLAKVAGGQVAIEELVRVTEPDRARSTSAEPVELPEPRPALPLRLVTAN
jgi:type II secretory ATPase GspE/PulE/Tfp pilus assembly ATPase PilB-like protein